MLSESASLILSTLSTTNPCIINDQKSNFVFKNIDLANVMGPMWDKYDMFALKVVSVSTATTPVISGSQYTILTYNMSGLPWVNIISENTGSHNIKQWAPITAVIVANASPNTTPACVNMGQSINFRKGQRIVDLEFAISWTDTANPSGFGGGPNAPAYPTFIFGNISFQFLIEPVIPGKMNECALFWFDTFQSLTNIPRIISTDRTTYTYPAFNMRDLCREFWDNHTDFEIQLVNYALRGVTTLTGSSRMTPIQWNGLNFVNNATKQSNATTNNKLSSENAIIGSFLQTTGGSAHIAEINNLGSVVQFKKDQDIVPITITFKNLDNTAVTPTNLTGALQPQWQFGFYIKPIYGVEKATLNINPFGLTTTQTSLGVRNQFFTTFTLYNIDMRQVCRSMWDKYKKFNIFLTNTVTTQEAGAVGNPAYLIQMSGFDFINQTAWITSNRPTQTATLGTMISQPLGTQPQNSTYQASILTTFYKTSDLVDLTLSALTLDGTGFNIAQWPIAALFTFTIVGVPEDENEPKQLVENRMKL